MPIDLPTIDFDSPLVQRLIPRIAEIAVELLDTGVASSPMAESLPAGIFTDDVVPVLMQGALAFVSAAQQGRSVSRADLANLLVPLAENLAADRISLPTLVTAYFAGVERLWQIVTEVAEPDDAASLGVFAANLVRLLGDSLVVVAETYSDVEYAFFASEHNDRRSLGAALVDGSVTTADLDRAGIAPADTFRVIALQVGTGRRSSTPGDELVARRRMRVVHRVLDHHSGSASITTFDGSSGFVLLSHEMLAGRPTFVGELIGEIGAKLDELYAAETSAAVDEIPSAAAETASVAELVQRLRRSPGLYRLDDVLYEYQVTRPGPARDRMVTLLAGLQDQPHLLDTLVNHLRYGSDRKAAAAALFIHPNTFTYRLKRIADITGLDPSTPEGTRLLAAAVTVVRAHGDPIP